MPKMLLLRVYYIRRRDLRIFRKNEILIPIQYIYYGTYRRSAHVSVMQIQQAFVDWVFKL